MGRKDKEKRISQSLRERGTEILSCSLNQTGTVLPKEQRRRSMKIIQLSSAGRQSLTWKVNIFSQQSISNLGKWYYKGNYGERRSFAVITEKTQGCSGVHTKDNLEGRLENFGGWKLWILKQESCNITLHSIILKQIKGQHQRHQIQPPSAFHFPSGCLLKCVFVWTEPAVFVRCQCFCPRKKPKKTKTNLVPLHVPGTFDTGAAALSPTFVKHEAVADLFWDHLLTCK